MSSIDTSRTLFMSFYANRYQYNRPGIKKDPLRRCKRKGTTLSCRTTLVDGLDQRQAATPFTPIAEGAGIVFDCADEILQHSLMGPMIADYRRRWAGILIH